jgi:hypothetical protein
LEPQIDSQIFERIEPVIAAFAAAGRREWSHRKVESKLLADLPVVQQELGALDATARASPDAETNAIEAAIEAAIRTLRDPFRTAALDQFAYTDDKHIPRTKGERETLAAKSFSKGDRWYRKASRHYHGLSPQDYVIALVTFALCGAPDPIASVARRESGVDDIAATDGDAPTSTAQRFVQYRWRASLGGALALCVVILALTLLGHGRDHVNTSTVNIGGAFAQAPKRAGPTFDTGEEFAGITLKACTTMAGCSDPSAKPVVTQRPGDVVSFRLDIEASYQEPIAIMNLAASTAPHNGFTEVTVVAEWKPPLATTAIETRTATVRVALQGPTPSGLPRLDYVPGTTKLYTLIATPVPEEVPFLKLPDGLFASSGITLEQIGPRRQHPVIRFADVGNIHFDMQVAVRGL